MRRVQELTADLAPVVFPRRIVTRPSSHAEDHDTVTVEEFESMRVMDGFAFWWTAHGLQYALPLSVDRDLQAGRCVVCNVSRTVIPALRSRYACVVVVLVTAPQEILAARLVARGRASDGNFSDRVARTAEVEQYVDADFVIDNVGPLDDGARRLHGVIASQLVTLSF